MVGGDLPLAGRDEGPGRRHCRVFCPVGCPLLQAVPRGPGMSPSSVPRPSACASARSCGGEAGFFAGAGVCRAQAGQQAVQMGQGQAFPGLLGAGGAAGGVQDQQMVRCGHGPYFRGCGSGGLHGSRRAVVRQRRAAGLGPPSLRAPDPSTAPARPAVLLRSRLRGRCRAGHLRCGSRV